MKRFLKTLGAAVVIVGGLTIAAGYFATMGVLGRFAPTLRAMPSDYGSQAQVVNFKSLDGIDLKGWWIPAQDTSAARGTVILSHGNGGNRSSMLTRAVFLTSKGYNAFPIDLRAHGESAGNYMTPGYLEALDILGALEAVKGKGQSGPFIALGHSYGARASLWAAARSNEISAVIAESGFISIYSTLKREVARVNTDRNVSFGQKIALQAANALSGSSLAKRFVEAVYKWRTGQGMTDEFDDVMPAILQIGSRPILFIVGEQDRIAPPEDSQKMYDAARSPSKAILIVPGADHNSTFTADRALYEAKVVAFLDTAVQR